MNSQFLLASFLIISLTYTVRQEKMRSVDLVVVIDTSGSMQDEANDLSSKASEAISNARNNCPSDLQVKWFGIEETWSNTKFDTRLRNYLLDLGVSNSDIVGRSGEQEHVAAFEVKWSDLELKEVKRIRDDLNEKLHKIGIDKPSTVGVITKTVKEKPPRNLVVVTLDELLE